MEADKLTVFLFLMLVVVMAFSGFVLYDALTGVPTFPKIRAGTNTMVGYNNGLNFDDSALTETVVSYNNGLLGGVR